MRQYASIFALVIWKLSQYDSKITEILIMLFRENNMNQNWPTRDKDLQAARVIMEEYASDRESDTLGLFEIVVDQAEKKMNFRLSGWVVILAKHFNSIYGVSQGDFVTRQIITRCLTQGQTLH